MSQKELMKSVDNIIRTFETNNKQILKSHPTKPLISSLNFSPMENKPQRTFKETNNSPSLEKLNGTLSDAGKFQNRQMYIKENSEFSLKNFIMTPERAFNTVKGKSDFRSLEGLAEDQDEDIVKINFNSPILDPKLNIKNSTNNSFKRAAMSPPKSLFSNSANKNNIAQNINKNSNNKKQPILAKLSEANTKYTKPTEFLQLPKINADKTNYESNFNNNEKYSNSPHKAKNNNEVFDFNPPHRSVSKATFDKNLILKNNKLIEETGMLHPPEKKSVSNNDLGIFNIYNKMQINKNDKNEIADNGSLHPSHKKTNSKLIEKNLYKQPPKSEKITFDLDNFSSQIKNLKIKEIKEINKDVHVRESKRFATHIHKNKMIIPIKNKVESKYLTTTDLIVIDENNIPDNIQNTNPNINKNTNQNSNPPKTKIIKKLAYKDQPGRTEMGTEKIYQDAHLLINNVFNLLNYNIIGVLDGHGMNGHHIANDLTTFFTGHFANYNNYLSSYDYINSPGSDSTSNTNNNFDSKENDTDNLQEELIYEKLKRNNYEVIRNAFQTADADLNFANYDINLSGSTCNIIMLLSNKIICASVGDSRAILVREKNGTSTARKIASYNTKKGSHNEVRNLSNDHKPNLAAEKERIIKCGGSIEKNMDDDCDFGPYRVYVKNQNYPGLAMSRAMGDRAAQAVGVISEPEIHEFEITEHTRYIVIASDGIWEFLDNNKVMNLVNPFYSQNDPQGACNALVQKAIEWWEKEDCVVDDITVIIVFF